MKHPGNLVLLFVAVYSQLLAQETDLKKIYTDVTTQINSSLLTRKGAYELTGNFFYDRLKTEFRYINIGQEFITETFQVDAGAAHFFMNNVSLGIMISYLNQKEKPYLTTTEQAMIGPVVKVYIGEKRWRPYLFADYLFMTGDVMDGRETDLGGGILYHVTGNFAVNLQLKYGFISAHEQNIKALNRLFVGIGLVNFIL